MQRVLLVFITRIDVSSATDGMSVVPVGDKFNQEELVKDRGEDTDMRRDVSWNNVLWWNISGLFLGLSYIGIAIVMFFTPWWYFPPSIFFIIGFVVVGLSLMVVTALNLYEINVRRGEDND